MSEKQKNVDALTGEYERNKDTKRPRIKSKDIELFFGVVPVKVGKDYMLTYQGVEYRNADKKALLDDLATVNGWKVE